MNLSQFNNNRNNKNNRLNNQTTHNPSSKNVIIKAIFLHQKII